MAKVKGSPQYRSVVVRYDPVRRIKRLVLNIVLLVIVALASAWGATYWTKSRLDYLTVERDELVVSLETASAALIEANQQVANLSTGSKVDRRSVDDVRLALKKQQQTIAALNEEITFYKGLMAPTDKERGLSIRGWEVYSTKNPQRFHYKLIVQQLAVKHRVLKGSVSVVIVGRDGELEKNIHLADVSEEVKARNVPLRFKYFQNIEGELELPDGFKPLRVDLVAKASTPKRAQVEKHYGWVVQES